MALSDAAIRAAKPKEKPYKIGDSGGLYVQITPSGGKLWRLKYRLNGKEGKLALGAYPDVGLAAARAERDKARELIASGRDPSREKQRSKRLDQYAAGHTFNVIALEYIAKRVSEGWSQRTSDKAEWYRTHLAPALGGLPVNEITAVDVLAELKKVEARGKRETAKRLLQFAGQVFRYAVATARLQSDPTRDLKGALAAPDRRNHGAIIEAKGAGELLRAIEGYQGDYRTLYALRLAAYLFPRPGELRQARWDEFDVDEAVWMIPAGRMKMRKPHAVPLSKQVLALLAELRKIVPQGPGGFVFPSVRSTARPMSENTLNAAIRRLGYAGDEMTSHGFRAMASTLLNEARDPSTKKAMWSADAIERALAHGHSDAIRGAYHRGAHWDERVEMAQWWSDYLDRLRTGADIVRFPKAVESK